jgi:glycosyltransferase involved in cell wall biosynthesis
MPLPWADMEMKALFVNRFFFPDESATSRTVSSLAFGLAEVGHSVQVVTGRNRHDGTRLSPNTESVAGVTIHRVWMSSFGRRHLLGRALEYLTFHGSAWWRIRRLAQSDDIVVACTDPPLLSVTAMLAISRSRATLVNWILDLFPEAAMHLGVLNSQSFSVRMLCRLRDASLRKARWNVVLTSRMAAPLEERGISPSALTVIPLWSDGAVIRPVAPENNAMLSEWQLRGKFVVGYSGNFGRVHEFATILDAAERLRDHRHIVFLFIGDGHRRGWIESEVSRLGLNNVLMKPLQPPEHLVESLGAPDVHLVSLLPHLETCSFPSKLYGILAAGRPTLFVGDLDGEVARVLREARCGSAIAVGDGAGLAERITELAGSEALRHRMGTNARRAFDAGFRQDIGIDRWHRLLTETLAPVGSIEAKHPAIAGAASAGVR